MNVFIEKKQKTGSGTFKNGSVIYVFTPEK